VRLRGEAAILRTATKSLPHVTGNAVIDKCSRASRKGVKCEWLETDPWLDRLRAPGSIGGVLNGLGRLETWFRVTWRRHCSRWCWRGRNCHVFYLLELVSRPAIMKRAPAPKSGVSVELPRKIHLRTPLLTLLIGEPLAHSLIVDGAVGARWLVGLPSPRSSPFPNGR
jgi:hypothetical protein